MAKALIDPRLLLARAMREEGQGGLRHEVEKLALALGWEKSHIRDSRGQNVIFLPDLLLWHTGKHRLLWAELKPQAGKLSPGQAHILEAFQVCRQEAYLWRPLDLFDGTIFGVLAR